MKKFRFVIPFIALGIIFSFTFSCTGAEPEAGEAVVEETEEEAAEPIADSAEEEPEVEEPIEEEPVVGEQNEEKNGEENIASMGDTILELEGYDDLSITFLSWSESNIAIEGPYIGNTYYTCTAKPGMKFVIIFFEFKNNGIRAQKTPYFNEGEITTLEKGYIYEIWSTGISHDEEEYNRRESTKEEVEKLTGSSGGYEELLPEESTKGCIVYEIPIEYTPYEATIELYSVEYLIRFNS